MQDRQNIAWKRLSAQAAAIVGSILLAFAIDAWWDERLEHDLGLEYERRIANELHDIRLVLESIERTVQRNIEMGEAASAFFDGDVDLNSHDWLIVSLYNMGRDSSEKFDVSTYEDLIATGRLGLIKDVARRQAIQHAYTKIRDLEKELQPYREEYLAGVRGWIPKKVIRQIREVCTSISEPEWTCSDVDIDDQNVKRIIEHLSTDKALLAFRLREQGLTVTLGYTLQTKEAVDEALAHLD